MHALVFFRDTIFMEDSKQVESKKWGTSLRFGWTAVPNILLRKQSDLSLSSDHLIVLINLIRFWWKFDKFPYPSIEKTSAETGLTAEKITNLINDLEKKELLRKVGLGGGKYGYDISPLSRKLSSFSTYEEKIPELATIISDDGISAIDVISKDNYIGYKIDNDKSNGVVLSRRINNQTGNLEEYSRTFNMDQNKSAILMFNRWNQEIVENNHF